jgi:hypothetical protein
MQSMPQQCFASATVLDVCRDLKLLYTKVEELTKN